MTKQPAIGKYGELILVLVSHRNKIDICHLSGSRTLEKLRGIQSFIKLKKKMLPEASPKSPNLLPGAGVNTLSNQPFISVSVASTFLKQKSKYNTKNVLSDGTLSWVFLPSI